jgi:hypothetical protein
MKPVINLEDPIGKTVGQRTAPVDAFRYGMRLQESGAEMIRTSGRFRIPKGVFRFHSHEEADAWMMKHQTREDPSQSRGSTA